MKNTSVVAVSIGVLLVAVLAIWAFEGRAKPESPPSVGVGEVLGREHVNSGDEVPGGLRSQSIPVRPLEIGSASPDDHAASGRKTAKPSPKKYRLPHRMRRRMKVFMEVPEEDLKLLDDQDMALLQGAVNEWGRKWDIAGRALQSQVYDVAARLMEEGRFEPTPSDPQAAAEAMEPRGPDERVVRSGGTTLEGVSFDRLIRVTPSDDEAIAELLVEQQRVKEEGALELRRLLARLLGR